MTDSDLEAANRALLDAIEAAPPAAGVEDHLDSIAATTWFYAREADRPIEPGRVRHLESKLADLAGDAEGPKRRRIERARERLRQYAGDLEPV